MAHAAILSMRKKNPGPNLPPKGSKPLKSLKEDSKPPFTSQEIISAWKSKIFPELVKLTEMDCVILSMGENLSKDDDPKKIKSSKIGGTPYWPKNKPYPAYGNNEPMRLFVQLNFDELPHIKDFPTTGILQFFAKDMEFESDRDHEFTRVIYHEKISEDTLTDIPVTSCNDDVKYPVFKGMFFLTGKIHKAVITEHDFRFSKMLRELTKKHLGYEITESDLWRYYHDVTNVIDDDLKSSYWEHRYGGYPSFTQWDPRDYDDATAKYDTMLLQIDSGDGIMWGDCGIANFFINREKLLHKNFNDVMFTWDCC